MAPVDDERSKEAGGPQRGQIVRGQPVAVGHAFDESLRPRSPAIQRSHVGFHQSFVEEDETVWVEADGL